MHPEAATMVSLRQKQSREKPYEKLESRAIVRVSLETKKIISGGICHISCLFFGRLGQSVGFNGMQVHLVACVSGLGQW